MSTSCEIPDCQKPRHGARWCQMHYRRHLYRGDPVAPNKNDDPVATFWSHVRTEDSDCWIWTGALSVGGYGKWKPPRQFPIQTYLAHRVAYYLHKGDIPEERPHLDHLCRVRPCVNPDHLEPVTLVENLRRGRTLITHCPSGHEYSEVNTYVAGNSRHCRICHRDRERARRARLHEHGGRS